MKVEKLAKNGQMGQNSPPLSPGTPGGGSAATNTLLNTIVNTAATSSANACACVLGYGSSLDNGITIGSLTLDCTKCIPGYYLTGSDNSPVNGVCSIVPVDKFHPGGGEVGAADEALTSCPPNSASVEGSDALIDCTVKPGYYIETKADGDADVTDLAISIVPANFYGAGGEVATTQVTNDVTATKLACPSNSASVEGSDALIDCTVKPGYYIETKADGDADVTNILISIVPVNFYGAGGEVATTQVANDVTATKLACPLNSASVAGSTKGTPMAPFVSKLGTPFFFSRRQVGTPPPPPPRRVVHTTPAPRFIPTDKLS